MLPLTRTLACAVPPWQLGMGPPAGEFSAAGTEVLQPFASGFLPLKFAAVLIINKLTVITPPARPSHDNISARER